MNLQGGKREAKARVAFPLELLKILIYESSNTRRSYYVFNYQMRFLKWMPRFHVKVESLIALIWVTLPYL